MESTFAYDVFLIHNQADKPRVRRLAEWLRAAGLCQNDFGFPPEAALAPAALGSDWLGLERSTVLFRDPSNAGRRFIPLLLADCKRFSKSGVAQIWRQK